MKSDLINRILAQLEYKTLEAGKVLDKADAFFQLAFLSVESLKSIANRIGA